MNQKVVISFLLTALVAVNARPRYIAIPIEDLQFVRPYYQPVAQPRMLVLDEDMEPSASETLIVPDSSDLRLERSPGYHGDDYVDYGAYTGGYGAFGWYSDHPVGGGYGYH